jgi:hypothetical protein
VSGDSSAGTTPIYFIDVSIGQALIFILPNRYKIFILLYVIQYRVDTRYNVDTIYKLFPKNGKWRNKYGK